MPVLDSIFYGSQLLLPLVNDEWDEQCTQQHQPERGRKKERERESGIEREKERERERER